MTVTIRLGYALRFPCPQIYEDFEKRFKLKVVEGYGLTEVAIITYNPYENPRLVPAERRPRASRYGSSMKMIFLCHPGP